MKSVVRSSSLFVRKRVSFTRRDGLISMPALLDEMDAMAIDIVSFFLEIEVEVVSFFLK